MFKKNKSESIHSLPDSRTAFIYPDDKVVILSIDGKKPVMADKGIVNYLKAIKSRKPLYKFECGKRTVVFKYFDASLKRDRVHTGSVSASFFFKSGRKYKLSASVKNEIIKFDIKEIK